MRPCIRGAAVCSLRNKIRLLVSEIGRPADAMPIKKQHGGKRPGAARKPNIAKRLLNGVKPMTAAEALEGIDVRAIVHDLLKNGSRPVELQILPR